MDRFVDVLFSSLRLVTADVFNYVASDTPVAVAVDELRGLDRKVFVVGAADLGGECVLHFFSFPASFTASLMIDDSICFMMSLTGWYVCISARMVFSP